MLIKYFFLRPANKDKATKGNVERLTASAVLKAKRPPKQVFYGSPLFVGHKVVFCSKNCSDPLSEKD